MKKINLIIGSLIVCVCFIFNLTAYAGDKATPKEVVQKVRTAADFLSKAGKPGLPEFNDPKGRWVWKDTYVWVLDCAKWTDATHPIKPKLVGMNLRGIKDPTGKFFFVAFCEVAKNPNGGWVEYMRPKVGEKKPSRKITYVLQVPNSPYQVAAGIYDENVSLNELNELIK